MIKLRILTPAIPGHQYFGQLMGIWTPRRLKYVRPKATAPHSDSASVSSPSWTGVVFGSTP